jgi:hypothetical protein
MTLRPGSVFKDRSNPLASTNTFALCCFGFGVLLLFVEDLGTAGHLLDPLVDQLHLHRRHRSRDREANNSKETAAKWSKWTSIVVNVSHVVKHYDHICQRSFSYYIIYISYLILYYIILHYIILHYIMYTWRFPKIKVPPNHLHQRHGSPRPDHSFLHYCPAAMLGIPMPTGNLLFYGNLLHSELEFIPHL